MKDNRTRRAGVGAHPTASDYQAWRAAHPLKRRPGRPLMVRRSCTGSGSPACWNFIRLPEFELS